MNTAGTRYRFALSPEAAGGAAMLAAALVAIALNNSPLHWVDNLLLDTPVSVRIGALALDKPLLLWINDGLMAVFFLYVGLEIKQEMLAGALSSWQSALLPVFGAVGGMIMPALIYATINMGHPVALRGWAIPAATDIAFAVAVLVMLGPRVPASLKVFLLALAIIDDLGAIIIIALFYTAGLSTAALGLAAIGVGVLAALNRFGVQKLAPFVVTGFFIWVCVLKSGVHATLAGVVVAMAIPMSSAEHPQNSMLDRLKHNLHPWVNFAILPLFAFANAGVSLTGFGLSQLFQPIPLGIILGLVLGKAAGISGAVWLAIRTGAGRLPDGATWSQLVAVAVIAGIGFTMSLFIGMLAFPDPALAAPLRAGVLAGSLVSAIAGYVLLRMATRAPATPRGP